jgi:hypothetical protein
MANTCRHKNTTPETTRNTNEIINIKTRQDNKHGNQRKTEKLPLFGHDQIDHHH